MDIKAFAQAAGLRALRTFAQVCVASIPTATLVTQGQVDCGTVLLTALVAAVLSVLTSIANGLPEVEGSTVGSTSNLAAAAFAAADDLVNLDTKSYPGDGDGSYWQSFTAEFNRVEDNTSDQTAELA